jgi:hypothetical protein
MQAVRTLQWLSALAALSCVSHALAQATAPATPSANAKPVTKTECTQIKLCYCVNTEFMNLINEKVATFRKAMAEQRAQGKAVGYLSIPLSTAAGGYFNVNAEVAAAAKARVEARFGANAVWVLNPAAPEATLTLPSGARGANPEYMLMWTQILEGANNFGEDFDFAYFAGPSDFAGFFQLTGTGDMETIAKYFDERLAKDAELKRVVDQGRVTRNSFRNYYALRASVAFSAGAHDEWNIFRLLNERRRSDAKYGVPGQLPVLFDGKGVDTGSFSQAVPAGSSGACKVG